ncbi:MAG: carbohydrate ABC transporter permease [Oscillospiraceae bacterium]|nr:carbohydrate ABC transporter permease [Oscillospiraceae bacterium]
MKKQASGLIWTIILSVVSALYLYPIIMVLLNSLKKESAITTAGAFTAPTAETFAGLENYVSALTSQGFGKSLFYSLFITISSVALILLCCSMCAWYISRVNNLLSRMMYLLCAFSMVVPFQMVMFTLSQTADRFRLFFIRFNNPYTICFIYLGFGAGLAVFMFTGFMRSVPIEIEEAAMIDGCSPLQTYFRVVFPILRPTMISVGILETMWVWNDYLLPTLVLDIKKYRTIPMLIQYFRGSYGTVEMGAMMASIMLTVIPVVIIYILGQKHIIKGVLAGAVKG